MNNGVVKLENHHFIATLVYIYILVKYNRIICTHTIFLGHSKWFCKISYHNNIASRSAVCYELVEVG